MTPEEKQQFLNSGLLDGIKTQEDLSVMLKELHSAALEAMLQGEMEHHLGYSKHEQNSSNNARNGSSSKHVRTEFGKSQIKVPRDRQGSFEPIVVPKPAKIVAEVLPDDFLILRRAINPNTIGMTGIKSRAQARLTIAKVGLSVVADFALLSLLASSCMLLLTTVDRRSVKYGDRLTSSVKGGHGRLMD